MYHGGGGFIHSEVYNMPIWLRKFHISRISEWNKKQNEAMEKAQGQSNIGDNNKVMGPAVNPNSTFNY